MVRLPVRSHRGSKYLRVLLFALEALDGRRDRVVFVTELLASLIWITFSQQCNLISCDRFRIINFNFVLRYFLYSCSFISLREFDNFLAFLLGLLSLAQRLRPLPDDSDLRMWHGALRCFLNIFFFLFEIEISNTLFWPIFWLAHKIINLHWE